ncbi:Zn-dependent hydrolase [Clostridium magnum]|uniref:N-carbamoyl-L-amino acid hydrolase n=1 Tax=Clostridium magnum DSM 2767 TaxID=1121326 RepID=A0A162SNK0_9CLOT|nr:Zn-dependent hydrolase [Clostridium magnum]KZL91663.1 N-carbamoyl-L-amino acid hydrolase [Clostridium magnum DSM 2767]SHH51519.1 allantoate deiminase [Clostridium magnum DSM 2767]
MKTNLQRIKKDIEQLAKFNSSPNKGLTRFSFTKEDREARNYIKNEMREAGLKVYEDAAGTIFGRLQGEIENGPVVMLGSHFDSVKNGGNFDGPAGVVMALEVARAFKENNVKPKYPIEFIAMIEEEGGRFGGGLFGSRSMAGKVSRESLDKYKDKDGVSIAEAMKEFGFDPDKIYEAERKSEAIRAFIELHIEQGPVLEKKNIDIGIVDYIVGIEEIEVTIKGRPDHAGTTPMNMRANALDAAAPAIAKVSEFAIEAGEGTVATIGTLNLKPGAANIVPSDVIFTVDIRSKKEECKKQVRNKIINLLKESTARTNCNLEIVQKLDVAPVKLDEQIVADFSKGCDELGFKKKVMLSGAGHDAMIIASIAKVGLIFVPSKEGRSHCPEEWTDYEDLQKGIELAYYEVLKLCK